MITDETARLIREADVKLMFDDGVPVIANLDKFAALVAAAERERIKTANSLVIQRINEHLEKMREDIRARGNT